VDCIITDPAYESLEKHRAVGTTTRLTKEWFDIFPNSRFADFFRSCHRALRKDSHLYFMCDAETMFVAKPIAEAAGFKFHKPIVWDKVSIGMGYHYRARYEFVLFFEKGKRRLNDLSIPDILTAKRVRGAYPTEKPVELLEVLVRQSTSPGELVVDPFAGSGATGDAAIKNGRDFLGADISDRAVMLANQRIGESMQKPNIKKKIMTPGQCAAMRCVREASGYASGAHWGQDGTVPLCPVHLVTVEGVITSPELELESAATDGALVTMLQVPQADESTLQGLEALRAEAFEAGNLLASFTIATREDLEFASEMLLDVKRKINQVATAEAKVTHPLRDVLERAREIFRPAKTHLFALEGAIKAKIADAKQREAADNERALQEARLAAENGDQETLEGALAKVRHESNIAGVTTRTGWTWELIDIDAVPREYLTVDEKKINALCRGSAEPAPVPGVRFVQRDIVVARAQA
jgi:site-specific DNA-methyltransferase (adenine-specific)